MARFRRDDEQSVLQADHQSNYGSISENEETMVELGALRSAKRWPQYIATAAASTGAFAAGCVLGWSSPAELHIRENAYGFPVTQEQFSWIGSLATVGAIFSCLIIGFIMDFFGRKNTMILLIVPFLIGWALIIWPFGIISIYMGRFGVGFAGGAFFVVLPAYIGEIATKDIRGMLGSCLQLMITVGILFAYVFGNLFELMAFNVICAMLPIMFGGWFIWMPESPYYYVMQNHSDKAKQSLKWLRGEEYNSNDELAEIQIQTDIIRRNRVDIWTAIQKPATRRGLLITVSLVLFVQFAGINAVIFYTGNIFHSAQTGINQSVATIIVGVMQVVATLFASLTIDKLGRRILLLTSALVMCICNIGLGVYFVLQENASPYLDAVKWLPIISMCLYIIAFSLGLGPIPWVLVGELYDQEVKGIASSLTGSISWLTAFIVTKFFTNISDLIGTGQTFFVFSVFAAMCTIFILILVPETKGKSFIEIQRLLGNNTRDNNDDDNQTTVTNISQNNINI